jgi:tetratricopeptide (TPR) repeat protein
MSFPRFDILLAVSLAMPWGCSGPSSLQRAQAAYETGNYDRAIAWSSKSIDEESGAVDAYLLRGKSYEKKGEHVRAIADYEVARNEAPDRGEPAIRQTRCYLAAGRPADAEASISKALSGSYAAYSVRDRMLAHAVHGEVQLATGDPPRASDSFDQALKVAKGSRSLEAEGATTAIHYNQSRALYEQGSYRQARDSFQSYLDAQKRSRESPKQQDLYTLTVLHFLCEDIAASRSLAAALSPEYKTRAEAILSGDTFSVRALYELKQKQKEKDPESESNP